MNVKNCAYLSCIFYIFFSFNKMNAGAANDSLNNYQSDSIERYLSILTDGKHSPSLYANLGYEYYQNGNLANAILYYEKALKLDPHNDQLQKSLDQIRSELPIQITDIPDFILVRWYRSAYNYLSSTTWSVIQLFAGIVLLYFLYRLLFRNMTTKMIYQWLIIGGLLVIILLTSFFAYHRKQFEIGGHSGVSLKLQEVYEGPDSRSGTVLTIGPGNKVYILDNIGEWYKIQVRDKDTGWILKENIALI